MRVLMSLAVGAVLMLPAAMIGGCAILGTAAAGLPPGKVPPAYEDLAGQTAAIWVWVDPAVDLDHPGLSLAVATRMQNNLETARDKGDNRSRRTLEGLEFTVHPASIVRYQKTNPQIAHVPITEFAPRLDVDRMIYVEVGRFTTQGGGAPGLWRGTAEIDLSVVEIDRETGAATIAYNEPGIRVAWPPMTPAEGSMTLGADRTYAGTVAHMGDELTKRFVPHPHED